MDYVRGFVVWSSFLLFVLLQLNMIDIYKNHNLPYLILSIPRKSMPFSVESEVQIYSVSKKKWAKGEVVRAYRDDEGEWLVVEYDEGRRYKDIQSFSEHIRPFHDAVYKLGVRSRGEVYSKSTGKQQTTKNARHPRNTAMMTDGYREEQ